MLRGVVDTTDKKVSGDIKLRPAMEREMTGLHSSLMVVSNT